MKKITDKLGLQKNQPFICTILSKYNVGKSTILSVIASELNEKASILFITEDRTNILIKRLINLGCLRNQSKITIKRIISPDRKISDYIADKKYDYVVIDSSFINHDSYHEMIDIKEKNGTSFFITEQAPRLFYINDFSISNANPTVIFGDLVVFIDKKKQTFIDKVKIFFGFRVDNMSFKILKNRFDKEFEFTHNIDFKKINE